MKEKLDASPSCMYDCPGVIFIKVTIDSDGDFCSGLRNVASAGTL